MNVSGVPNEIYRPCYRLNSSTGKIESGSYNYSALMRNIQKQEAMAKEEIPKIGDKELSESEIEELAKRYDPKNMSQAEYDDFIRFLQEKGVLSNIEANNLGMSRCTVTPGYFESVHLSGALFGKDMHVNTLHDVDGNAIRFAGIMCQWQGVGDVQIRQNAYHKVLGILERMDAIRRQE